MGGRIPWEGGGGGVGMRSADACRGVNDLGFRVNGLNSFKGGYVGEYIT